MRIPIPVIELRDAAPAEQFAKAQERPGHFGYFDRQQRFALRPDVGALGDIAQTVEVHVRTGIDRDERARSARFARRVLLDARHRQGAGGLRDGARVLEDVLNCGANLIGGHEQDLIDVLLGEAESLLADAAHRDAVGEDADAIQRHAPAGTQRFEHSGRVLGLDADDLDPRIQRFRVGRNPGDQTAAADRNEDRVDGVAVQLAQDFHADRTLTGDHVRIVERVHEHQTALARQLDGPFVGMIVVVAVQHDLAAQIGDRLHLDFRRRQRHDDEGGYAARARTERDALGVVARGGANDAALRTDRGELSDLVVRTANFERKHRLEVFPLEEHAIVQAARQARRHFQRGLGRDVVHLGFEDSFYVIFLHGLLEDAGGYISSSQAPRVCLPETVRRCTAPGRFFGSGRGFIGYHTQYAQIEMDRSSPWLWHRPRPMRFPGRPSPATTSKRD